MTMSGSYIDSTGFHRMTLAERKEDLEALWISVFGSSIDMDPDSPDGQIIGILAEKFSSLDGIAEVIYNGLASPNGASGTMLSNLVLLSGLSRKTGSATTVTAILGGVPGTVVGTTALARCTEITDSTVTFSPVTPITIGANGTGTGVFRCNQIGDFAVPAGSLTKIQTVIPGWEEVTNAADGVRGFFAETDERLRWRRQASVALPANGMTDALWAAILNIPDVSRASVWDNRGSTAITLPGGSSLPGKSLLCIVDGGLDEAIASVIWRKTGIGVGFAGTTAVPIWDAQGHRNDVNFSRPSAVDVYITLTIERKSGWTSDGADRIKAEIVRQANVSGNIEIGGDSNHEFAFSDVIKWATGLVPGFSVVSAGIGRTASPTPWTNLKLEFNEVARVDLTRIAVTVL